MPEAVSDGDYARFGGSLRRRLLSWFLVLALAPLTLMSAIGYWRARSDLREVAVHELEESMEAQARFFHNWIDYRRMDLRIQAESRGNAGFLGALRTSWQESGLSLEDFVSRDAWAEIPDRNQRDLVTLASAYDYISDLLLIDAEGNVLFTVARNADLGTNLFDGAHSNTRFARSARASLETGQERMSDLERYAPSGALEAAFLTAPLQNEQGEIVGVFAMQISIDRIMRSMDRPLPGRETARTYLVGEDGLVRTPLRGASELGVLRTRIDSEPLRAWLTRGGEGEAAQTEAAASTYTGPLGSTVIGLHRDIEVLGVRWALVAEIDEREALATANRLGLVVAALMILTAVGVAAAAAAQARRITRPLAALTEFSRKATHDRLDREMAIPSDDEIGELTHAFNQMVRTSQLHEQRLRAALDSAREAEVMLERKVEDLAHSNQELDSFAYIASHDLKEPLRGIHNYARFLLEDHAEQLDEEGRRMLSALPRLSQRLENLIDALLRYARSGRKELHFSDVSLQEVAMQEIELLRDTIEETGVEIRIPDELPTIECDPAVASDVYRELLGNALKYNDKQERWIELGVLPSNAFADLRDEAPFPVPFVRDNGIGISEKHLRTIFRIFKRLHVRDRYGSGSGAGLTIIDKLLTRCGGRIWAESTPGEQTTFYFIMRGDPDE